jgi:hypothetical protein
MTMSPHADAILGQAGTQPAQHCADAGGELGHRERLDHIVVGAGVQATNAVGLLAARRQHDDRHVAALTLLAQTTADLDARDLG